MKQHFEALVLPDGMRAVPVFIGTFLCVLYAGMGDRDQVKSDVGGLDENPSRHRLAVISLCEHPAAGRRLAHGCILRVGASTTR